MNDQTPEKDAHQRESNGRPMPSPENDAAYWQDKWKRRGLVIESLRADLADAQAEAARYFTLLDHDVAMALIRDIPPGS